MENNSRTANVSLLTRRTRVPSEYTVYSTLVLNVLFSFLFCFVFFIEVATQSTFYCFSSVKATNVHGFQGSVVWPEWLSRSPAHPGAPLGQFSTIGCAGAAAPATVPLCRGIPPGRAAQAAPLWAAAPGRAQCAHGECVCRQGWGCVHRWGSSLKNSLTWCFVVATADSDFISSSKVGVFSGTVHAPFALLQVGTSCLQPLLILLSNS